MAPRPRQLVVRVLTGALPGPAAQLSRWIRTLLPAAVLLVGPGPVPAADPETDDVITLEADAIPSGPLSLADALLRRHARHESGAAGPGDAPAPGVKAPSSPTS